MKIFKLFVSISLILTISLINSFAAISVSDGSAFVTKAEFAADLNNLSNRMSSLENSLDAKIDSLVSSYLSRNGIWNGEKQEVNTPPTTQVGLKWISASTTGWVLNQTFNSTGQITGNGLYISSSFKYVPNKTDPLESTIVSSLSKSGLANLLINFSNTYYTFSTFLGWEGTNSSTSVHGDHWGSSFTQEYSVSTGSDLVYYDVFNFNMPTHAAYRLNYKTKINCYFFVEKGKDITLTMTPSVHNGSTQVRYQRADNMGCKISSWSVSVY